MADSSRTRRDSPFVFSGMAPAGREGFASGMRAGFASAPVDAGPNPVGALAHGAEPKPDQGARSEAPHGRPGASARATKGPSEKIGINVFSAGRHWTWTRGLGASGEAVMVLRRLPMHIRPVDVSMRAPTFRWRRMPTSTDTHHSQNRHHHLRLLHFPLPFRFKCINTSPLDLDFDLDLDSQSVPS